MKEIVLNKVKDNRREYVDFVSCCNCGNKFLVDIGTEKCPNCFTETLIWADDQQEVDFLMFEEVYKNKYLLCD